MVWYMDVFANTLQIPGIFLSIYMKIPAVKKHLLASLLCIMHTFQITHFETEKEGKAILR